MLFRIEPNSRTRCLVVLQAAVIVMSTWFVFGSVIRAGWLWDDGLEVTKNTLLRIPAGLWRIWFAPSGLDYFPLKSTVQWVQWHLWQDRPAGYHVTNVCLHLLSAFLLWRVLSRLGVRLAWLGGLIFAIHPLVVESVAWISELKNVLSLPFLLLAFDFWISQDAKRGGGSGDEGVRLPRVNSPGEFTSGSLTPYAESDGGAGTRRSTSENNSGFRSQVSSFCDKKRLLSLALFVLAMLCKSSVVMFPVILLLYCWWKRGRVTQSDFWATAPFFAVSLVLGLVTVWFQVHRAIADVAGPSDGFLVRFAVAGWAVAFYFWKSIWPVGLLPIYPRWAMNPPALWQFWPWVVIVGGVLGLLAEVGRRVPALPVEAESKWRRRDASPHLSDIDGSGYFLRLLRLFAANLIFGLGFFFINLLPVLGLFPMAYQRISWVADHFVYLPLVGLAGLAAAGIGGLFGVAQALASAEQSGDGSPPAVLSTAGGTPALRQPALLPQTALSLAVAALVVALAVASRNYARVFESEKTLWTYATDRNPGAWIGYNNLGIALRAEGRREEAIAFYEKALALRPDFAEANNDLGAALAEKGSLREAFAHYERAIRAKPDLADAYNNEGNLLFDTGNLPQAIGRFRQALRFNPDFAEAHNGLGNGLARTGRPTEAIAEYQAALRIKPDFPEALSNLGAAFANAGRLDEAIASYEQVLSLHPDFAQAHNNLGVALAQAGRVPEAIAQYQLALHYDPGLSEARANLDRLNGRR